jgi:MoxR-like ATPase
LTQQETHQAPDFICVCGRHDETLARHNFHKSKCPAVGNIAREYSNEPESPEIAYSPGMEVIGIPTPPVEDTSPWVFTERGEAIIRELLICAQEPNINTLLIGESGYGKSVVVREVARRMGRVYSSLNGYPGMDIGLLVGQMFPRPMPQGGITLEWQNGTLTESIINGSIFFFEELTRAPQEAISRLFGLLDQGFSYYNIPEAGIDNIPINPNFWFVGTANPAGRGYQTSRLDPALESRFGAIFEINEPLADEPAIMENILPVAKFSNLGPRLQRFVYDTRRNDSALKDAGINTRDMVSTAQLIARGFTPESAVERAVVSKNPSAADGLRILARAHFQGKYDMNTATMVEVVTDAVSPGLDTSEGG